MSFREGTSGKGDMEGIGGGVAEGARSVAETAWKPGLLTPSLVLISILGCLHFPGRVKEGEGSSGELEPPACEVWSQGFPSNDNRIDGGGVSRDHWGQPAGLAEGRTVQVCVEQALQGREEGSVSEV